MLLLLLLLLLKPLCETRMLRIILMQRCPSLTYMWWLPLCLALTALEHRLPLLELHLGPALWFSWFGHTAASSNPTACPLILAHSPKYSQPRSQFRGPGGPLDPCFVSHVAPGRGEGGMLAMEHSRVDNIFDHDPLIRPSTNIHGHKPVCWGSFKHLHPHNKRSFKRAQVRASRDGFALYKGRVFDRQQLGCPMKPTVQAKPSSTRSQPNRTIRDLRVLAWNSTGLASWKLDELRGWLHGQPFQLVVVSETRWEHDKEWTEDGWFHVACSGNPFRSCGLLVMVRTSFCTSTQISWQSLIPGRLLHLRIHLDRPLDVIGCYQYTFVNQGSCKQNP